MNDEAFDRLMQGQAESQLYQDSDSVALFEDTPCVVRTEPIFLKDGQPFIQIGGAFYQPDQFPGFLRVERKPSARPRPQPIPLPVYTSEPRAPKVENQNIFERLAAAQARWAEEKQRTK